MDIVIHKDMVTIDGIHISHAYEFQTKDDMIGFEALRTFNRGIKKWK